MLCVSPRLEMGPVWWISCTWEQYIELHVCPALRRDTFLFHMFVQLRDPRKPNSGVCLRRQIGIVLCACKCLPPPCLPQPLCVCVCAWGDHSPPNTFASLSSQRAQTQDIYSPQTHRLEMQLWWSLSAPWAGRMLLGQSLSLAGLLGTTMVGSVGQRMLLSSVPHPSLPENPREQDLPQWKREKQPILYESTWE